MKIQDFQRKKERQDKICMLTCYDYPSACTVAESTIDCVLVGDSVAMAVHGHPSTVMATMEMMVLHTAAVARGLKTQFLVADLPFLAHRASRAETVHNALRLMQAGAHGIKIEGGDADTCETIYHLVQSGVPVMGHIGLTPQSVHQLGGFRVQGRNDADAKRLLQQAAALEAAGCFALVIECVPKTLAKVITAQSKIPTIGIGAGADTDGQVLVWHDALGLQSVFKPKFVRRFAESEPLLLEAINQYADAVRKQHYPAEIHAFQE
ncbi:3-methyl-2-oxobutanoate hydroxymethyltransferase [Legionella geestiana]|uniref:3-methyl-2-oxobutanoate hydroxymethyltransferase n=1 Tax=Legionella geestiana TaxID=45065 RepID=A0A0W0U3N2_9GAMM|nr:3-methyl-2-oxobutanoate hydroxymethyltransferase [Legionella geestiana]KTD02353.1 3-methyl-2-oxobutanoate hydroxymethyltransferase [Legionella geestiana]QBS12172.1 3-methyl-2-oxobutanoate hydroxymethyltransferase [Legionella geestiana]STX53099.1 3-methyl-2-oxobutanoate hydroxymethyltransferase [Legionella geestiana]